MGELLLGAAKEEEEEGQAVEGDEWACQRKDWASGVVVPVRRQLAVATKALQLRQPKAPKAQQGEEEDEGEAAEGKWCTCLCRGNDSRGEAMKKAKLDRMKIVQGKTFTAQRHAIRASCLAAEEAVVPQVGQDKTLLSYPGWGLPEVIVQAYEEMGVRTLFPWQVDCLEAGQGRVLRQGCNLVYSAPTSGGKTLVAELLMLRSLTHAVESGTALFVVPFIALAEEKAKYFRRVVRTYTPPICLAIHLLTVLYVCLNSGLGWSWGSSPFIPTPSTPPSAKTCTSPCVPSREPMPLLTGCWNGANWAAFGPW